MAKRPVLKRSKTFFYVEERLYRFIYVNRAMGIIVAIDTKSNQEVIFSYADFKKRSYWAYTAYGVALMINRNSMTVRRLVKQGYAPAVDILPGPGPSKNRYFLNKTCVRQIHQAFASMSKGRPRKDGTIRIKDMPTREELETQLNDEVVLYAKSSDGESFVRVWKSEEDWG